ncbi:MAG: LptF/LptG family permease [Pyrinomonadaceae bacterium]
MKQLSLLICQYLIRSILPYFIFSWLLLSVILFAQQASRFSDIFFSVNIPTNLVWQLTLALIPNVIAFTCPMAVLVGTIIGLSKMQGDSELVAIRAAGVGNVAITIPIFVLGIMLSAFAFFINVKGVPFAAGIVRSVALQTAIQKLESPIEPGVFNSEIDGYTIYVKDGDIGAGTWKDIFIYNKDDSSGLVRLITSSQGRIDTSGELSELVLEKATVSSFSEDPDKNKLISESLGDIRIAIKTKRGELIEKLSNTGGSPEELGLNQLSEYAEGKQGKERIEAQILLQRRLILSITPLIFCLLGTAMILRLNRGGRGFGVLLALVGLVGYYLLAFLGEQLARTETISVFAGSLIPIVSSLIAITWFIFSGKITTFGGWGQGIRNVLSRVSSKPKKVEMGNVFVDLTTGLRDFDIGINLLKFFLLALTFLAAIFLIFTAFELWKFAGTFDGGIGLLVKYLFYLLPFIYLQLSPSAAMIATLATFVIKSRQNEIVTWTSAGQSVYRLLIPCFLLTAALGAFNWQVQERILPKTNQIQDDLRTRIRSRGVVKAAGGKYWVASGRRIYSFGETASDNEKANSASVPTASDNEKQVCSSHCVSGLRIYEFDEAAKLQSVYHVSSAFFENGRVKFVGAVETTSISEGKSVTIKSTGGEIAEGVNPFIDLRSKPSHLNISDTKAQIDSSGSEVERRGFSVALQKKYSTAFLPFIIALFTAPFALSLSRKGKVVTVGHAVGLWLLFTGVTSVFEQFGLNGFLSPQFSIWSPLVLFTMLGIYLLSRVKT